eukprot:6439492-Prymnesium_polylepis.1
MVGSASSNMPPHTIRSGARRLARPRARETRAARLAARSQGRTAQRFLVCQTDAMVRGWRGFGCAARGPQQPHSGAHPGPSSVHGSLEHVSVCSLRVGLRVIVFFACTAWIPLLGGVSHAWSTWSVRFLFQTSVLPSCLRSGRPGLRWR